jgi:hypothetical protein
MSANVATKPKTRPVAAMRICLFMTLFSCGPLREKIWKLGTSEMPAEAAFYKMV